MKAAFIRKLGPPEVIEFGDLPTPEPAAGQALVKVIAVAVDPIDTYIRSGAYPIELQFPFVVAAISSAKLWRPEVELPPNCDQITCRDTDLFVGRNLAESHRGATSVVGSCSRACIG